jgi:hypothetical protein
VAKPFTLVRIRWSVPSNAAPIVEGLLVKVVTRIPEPSMIAPLGDTRRAWSWFEVE